MLKLKGKINSKLNTNYFMEQTPEELQFSGLILRGEKLKAFQLTTVKVKTRKTGRDALQAISLI